MVDPDDLVRRAFYHAKHGERVVDLSKGVVGALTPAAVRDLLSQKLFRSRLAKARVLIIGSQRFARTALTNILSHTRLLEAILIADCDPGPLGWTGLSSPKAVAVLQRLETFEASGCGDGDALVEHLVKAATVPLALRALRLEACDLSSRGMDLLGECANAVRELRSLDVSRNRLGDTGIESLASASDAMPFLETLELGACEMSDRGFAVLTDALCREPWRSTLKYIWARRNAVKNVPREVLDTHDAEGWRDLRAAQERGGATLNVVKVLILGEGGSGKTHVVERVCNRKANYFNPAEPRTHDFKVHTRLEQMPKRFSDEWLDVRVYDFGGQPELHSSHRLFLSNRRALYVIVCDAMRTRDANRLDYWLRYVRFEAGPDVPVLVVVTKCDLFDAESGEFVSRKLPALNAEQLRVAGGFSSRAHIRVFDGIGGTGKSNTGRRGRRRSYETDISHVELELGLSLSETVGLLTLYEPEAVRLFQWIESNAFRSLDGKRRPFVSVRTVLEAARQFGIDAALVPAVLTECDSAGIVHLGASATSRPGEPLASLAFDPDWLRTPVYRIIRARDVSRQRGLLTWEQIETLLPTHGPDPKGKTLWDQLPFTAADRVAVVDLMVVRGLLFRIGRPDEPPSYFVPDHLEASSNRGSLVLGGHWQRSFEWLPESTFGRLIGSLLQHNPTNASVVSRDECVIELSRGSMATLRLHGPGDSLVNGKDEGRVVVTAEFRGSNPREIASALSAIDHELRAVLREESLAVSAWEWVDGPIASSDRLNSATVNGALSAKWDRVELDTKLRLLVVGLAQLEKEPQLDRNKRWFAMSPWLKESGLTRQREPRRHTLIRELEQLGLVERDSDRAKPRFRLTAQGRELAVFIMSKSGVMR